MRQPDRGLPARPARLHHPGRSGRPRAEHQQRGAAAETGNRVRHRQLQPGPDHQRHQPRRMADVRRVRRTVWQPGHGRELPEHDLLHAQRVLRAPVDAAEAAAIAAKYPLTNYPSPSIALAAVGTDAILACPALSIDKSLSRFVPTFAYEFNDENAPEVYLPPVSFPYGAAHASEIQYLMDLPTAAFPQALSAPQQQLAATMKGYWTNFAKRGFPSSPGAPFWPLFNNLIQKMQSLAPAAPQTETD